MLISSSSLRITFGLPSLLQIADQLDAPTIIWMTDLELLNEQKANMEVSGKGWTDSNTLNYVLLWLKYALKMKPFNLRSCFLLKGLILMMFLALLLPFICMQSCQWVMLRSLLYIIQTDYLYTEMYPHNMILWLWSLFFQIPLIHTIDEYLFFQQVDKQTMGV